MTLIVLPTTPTSISLPPGLSPLLSSDPDVTAFRHRSLPRRLQCLRLVAGEEHHHRRCWCCYCRYHLIHDIRFTRLVLTLKPLISFHFLRSSSAGQPPRWAKRALAYHIPFSPPASLKVCRAIFVHFTHLAADFNFFFFFSFLFPPAPGFLIALLGGDFFFL